MFLPSTAVKILVNAIFMELQTFILYCYCHLSEQSVKQRARGELSCMCQSQMPQCDIRSRYEHLFTFKQLSFSSSSPSINLELYLASNE